MGPSLFNTAQYSAELSSLFTGKEWDFGQQSDFDGQLYHGHTNTTALSSSPVVSALGSELDDSGSSPGWGKVLCP